MILSPGAARAALMAFALTLGYCSQAQSAASAGPPTSLTVEEVVSRLEQRNQERADALRQFEGSRTYHLQYRGFPANKDAEMLVEMNFEAPASKTFKVISQTGSKFIVDHILMKLLQSEQEALQEENRRQSALSRENYVFTLAGYETQEGSGRYILNVTPKSKNKFLYQGRIWVDATDFAVTHIEGEPAKNPSFWIKKTSIQHKYMKIGGFWLPSQNRTESQTRLGGKAVLTIDYTNYRIVSVAPASTVNRASAQRL
jgi:hypothetical protein